MSKLVKKNEGAKFAHVSVGNLRTFDGKEFVKEQSGATSCEMSFGTLAPGAAVPFFHSHKANEEHYIILSGTGVFQVDDDVFSIGSGSVVRVTTGCDRSMRNTGTESMVYICIQAKEGSLGGYTMTDAEITERKSLM